jgi:RND family efflux transporter MFP subunit
MKKKIIIALCCILAAAFVFLYAYRLKQAKERMQLSAKEPEPVPVSLVAVKKGNIKDVIYATGTIRAADREYCYFQTSGRVNKIMQVPIEPGSKETRDIKEGDRVKKGDQLATLDLRTIQHEISAGEAAIKKAKASYNKAKIDAERYKTLWQNKATSKTEYERAQVEMVSAMAALESEKAALEKSKLDLEHAKILAPCDGVIAYMNIKKGYYYGNGSMQFETESDMLNKVPFLILKDNWMELETRIPEYYAGLVEPGMKAGIEAPKYIKADGKRKTNRIMSFLPGKVYSVNPAIDPGGRSLQVKIRLKADGGILRDGQFVAGWIVTQEADDALLLPYKAIIYEDAKPYCFLVKDNKAVRRFIQTGIDGLETTQITSGLKEGNKVVLDGKHRLVEGSPVLVVKKEKAPPTEKESLK